MNNKNLTTTKLKNKFMSLIANNEEIFRLIDNADVQYADDLIGKNIFPEIMVKWKPEIAETYIGLKIDYPSIAKNELYKNYYLVIMVISNVKHIKAPSGDSRVDLISEELIKLFNWNRDIGFELQLYSDIEDILNDNYYYRKLIFKSIAFNDENRY